MTGGHAHPHAPAGAEPSSERRLWIALALTGTFLAVEVIASFLTGSLALLSDAGHMATDVAGLGIALMAIRIGRRPADERRSFGYRRSEILAAAINAAGLFVVVVYVLLEAVGRLRAPAAVDATGMLLVAALGLIINAIAMRLLYTGQKASINVRSAYLEVWADFLGSVAVLAAATLIAFTGVTWVDPLAAMLIALWILPRGWSLLRAAMHVLLEGTPEGLDPEAVKRTIVSIGGVRRVHDLHLWSITTGVPLLTAHVELETLDNWDAQLAALRRAILENHQIGHVTVQPEVMQSCRVSCSPEECVRE
ncbi:MAG: cation transporter [Gammaproteobacteria bacterium]|nr:MAG: cation transporter [Gammaproteobacteria bacterium]